MRKNTFIFSGAFILFCVLLNNYLFIDAIFLVGVSLFLIGGTILIIEKRVFDFFFQSVQKFLRVTSKVDAYVASETGTVETTKRASAKFSSTTFTFTFGIILIICSLMIALFTY